MRVQCAFGCLQRPVRARGGMPVERGTGQEAELGWQRRLHGNGTGMGSLRHS